MIRLGQHFLTDKKILQKIADALELREGDTVIEIGPGHGELTQELRSKNQELRIIAIEKDKGLAELLQKKFGADKNTKIISGDALEVLPSLIHDSCFLIRPCKLAGNLPYYITGHLLRVLGELVTLRQAQGITFTLMVFTIQKEVAERVVAKPPKMNLLAASVQIWAEPEILATIPQSAFNPPPKVGGAIIRLRIRNKELGITPEKYYKLIKILFKQPRKTILNNLAEGTNENKAEVVKKLEKVGIKPTDRPQNLAIEQLVMLARAFLG